MGLSLFPNVVQMNVMNKRRPPSLNELAKFEIVKIHKRG
jgi:hypothetical protein